MIATIKAFADQFFEETVRNRQHLHAHPELAFEEYETAAFIQAQLVGMEVTIEPDIAKTGLVVTLQGTRPGPTRALRADMDALPIVEQNLLPFSSTRPGKMHACGHDAHTASLITTIKILHSIREHLHGTVRFLFQPSEEKLPGGAKVMIEEGALAARASGPAPAHIFGQHVAPELPTGTIGVRSGMYMASTEEIYLTVSGQGGHGAAPHLLTADAVLVASHIVVALQSIISRNCPPDSPSVLSFGRFMAEGATNVLPQVVQIEGTFRAMDEKWRFQAHDLIRRVATQTAEAFGATCEVEIKIGYPCLYNDPAATRFVREAAQDYVGPAKTIDLDRWFAAEDFAFYLQELPGVFYRLGTGNAACESTYGLHHPRFTIDEEALRIGPGFMAYLALHYEQYT
ncbi:MAG: amidohydrolase [Bacteroidetes Order II. Incertae sedis bacterium]|nr:amidohydrolase [Bacteroidetes Order II. bacterium]